MAKFAKTVTTTEEAPSNERELLKPGKYSVIVTDSTAKSSRNGTAEWIEFELTIDENEHPDLSGRRVWTKVWTGGVSDTAMQISEKLLESLVYAALGPDQDVEDSETLHGAEVVADVKVSKGSEGYSDSNDVGFFHPRGETETKLEARKMSAPRNTNRPAWANKK